ncbi:LysM peptidoglycan-binding domain-containing protein [Streptomyces sp. NPDC058757]|uniref:LysM peptidoglycan-binding domain-containing protein n=1 Tax=Streptomyces sp. NPDC058757 TaxID=3346626 RepID=UPI00369FFFC0
MTPAPLRTAGLLLRAVLGLVVLAALVAGVPYLLLAVGHQPTELADGGFSLLEQDDGRLFLVVLTCLGWAGWAAFTLSVLVELVAVLRRRSAPKIRGLGSMQSLASFLVGGIVLLAPTAASAATVAPAVAATATHTVGEAGTMTGAPSAVSARAGETGGLTHTVASTSELPWDLAEDYLGDGKRWKDIAALNPDIPQLAAGDQYLPKGAVIKLPAGARPAAAAAPAAGSAGQAPASVTRVGTSPATSTTAPKATTADTEDTEGAVGRVTVRAGDSLWSIADAHGDPEDWPAIYEANRGEAVPGGGTFTDPNKIYPGQVLDLPQHTGPQPTAPQRPAPKPAVPAQPDAPKAPASPSPAPPPTADADADADKDVPAAPAPTADTNEEAPSAAETAAPARTAPAPERSAAPVDDTASAPAPGRTSPAPPRPAPEPAGQASENTAEGIVLAVAGGLAAAGGVVLMLRRRRALQRRRREPGTLIAMPDGSAAATEKALHSADSSTELLLLDLALRTLATRLADEDRDLPALAAVQLGDGGVLLHLSDAVQDGDDAAPAAPFTAVTGRPGVWWCPADSADLLDPEQAADVAAPYPALVLLGSDPDGALLLVDLDEFGALHLTGRRHLQMLRTLAVSLALSPLGQVDVAVAGEDTAPGLGLLDAQRVQEHPDLQAAADSARVHHTSQQQLMADTGLPGMSRARLSPEAEEFSPLVVLADLDTCPGSDATGQLDVLLRDEPLSSTTLITSSSRAARGTGEVWEINTDYYDFPVPNTPLRCVLSMCSDDEYADILTLAVTADSPTGVPAPPPVPLDKLLPGADAAGVSVPPPTAPVPLADGKPSLLALLSDLDDEDDDASEEASAQPLAGDSTDTGARSAPEAPADSADSARSSSTPDSGTAGTAAGAGDATDAVPVLPASASPGHVVLSAARALPQITVRLPAASTTPPEPANDDGRNPELPKIVFPQDQPMISILGTVEITGARGTVDSNRRTRATELATFLVLHPGATAPQVDEVLSPRGGLTSPSTRNTRLRDVRRWLGNDDEGQPYFRRMAKHADGHRIIGVECDWLQFQLLHDAALQLPRAQGQVLLRRALELVRGRPFSGVSSTYYSWAEPVVEEINDKVVNAAALLADWLLETGDGRGALWAAGRGLNVAREREELWRHRFRALALLGDHDGLEQSIQRLETLLTDHGWAMEEETTATIRMVQTTRA